jgi:hypothetical protein
VRVIRSIQALADNDNVSPEYHVQRFVDLLHIEAAVRDRVDPACYRAVSPQFGGVSYRELVRRTGLAKSAIQRRVQLGAEALGVAAQEEQSE